MARSRQIGAGNDDNGSNEHGLIEQQLGRRGVDQLEYHVSAGNKSASACVWELC